MRIGWVGFHMEGVQALRAVLEDGYAVQAVITLRPDKAAKRSGRAEYGPVCEAYGVPLHEVDNINSDESVAYLRGLALDVVFVIGWTQIVRPQALELANIGMIGAHASLLPHNRGRAPINWVLIRGEEKTGNSLIWLADSVDSGHIIDQTEFQIGPYDTCASLYEKVADSNRDMILRLLPKLAAGEKPGRVQPVIDEPLLPGRRPADGLIDWSTDHTQVYNFVRGLTKPYPGAFSWLDGRRWHIWQSALLPGAAYVNRTPGEVVGPLYSPIEAACGQVIACGKGALALLEVEDDAGTIWRGRQLSDQKWEGLVWTNG